MWHHGKSTNIIFHLLLYLNRISICVTLTLVLTQLQIGFEHMDTIAAPICSICLVTHPHPPLSRHYYWSFPFILYPNPGLQSEPVSDWGFETSDVACLFLLLKKEIRGVIGALIIRQEGFERRKDECSYSNVLMLFSKALQNEQQQKHTSVCSAVVILFLKSVSVFSFSLFSLI